MIEHKFIKIEKLSLKIRRRQFLRTMREPPLVLIKFHLRGRSAVAVLCRRRPKLIKGSLSSADEEFKIFGRLLRIVFMNGTNGDWAVRVSNRIQFSVDYRIGVCMRYRIVNRDDQMMRIFIVFHIDVFNMFCH